MRSALICINASTPAGISTPVASRRRTSRRSLPGDVIANLFLKMVVRERRMTADYGASNAT